MVNAETFCMVKNMENSFVSFSLQLPMLQELTWICSEYSHEYVVNIQMFHLKENVNGRAGCLHHHSLFKQHQIQPLNSIRNHCNS